MKYLFNKYNIVNFSAFVFFITTVIERLIWFLSVQMNLMTIVPLVIFICFLRLIIVFSSSVLFFTILWDFSIRNAEFDYFRNSIKSYIVTWKIRRYCTHVNVEPTLEESARYTNTKQKIIKKANHSLLTLTVTFYKDHAILKGKLPPNTESSDLIENLFPKIKKELNLWDTHYKFSDILRGKNRSYSSTATNNEDDKNEEILEEIMKDK